MMSAWADVMNLQEATQEFTTWNGVISRRDPVRSIIVSRKRLKRLWMPSPAFFVMSCGGEEIAFEPTKS